MKITLIQSLTDCLGNAVDEVLRMAILMRKMAQFSLILLFDLLTSGIISNNANTMSEKTELLLKNLDEIKSYFPHENESSWADKYQNANIGWITFEDM